MLVSQVLVPPAMCALLDAPTNRVQGFLAAGHVCAVVGYEEYEPIAARYRVPTVVTGFEPLDIRSVRREGNRPAQDVIREVFQIVPRRWRGIGEIAQSGLGLSDAYLDRQRGSTWLEGRAGLVPRPHWCAAQLAHAKSVLARTGPTRLVAIGIRHRNRRLPVSGRAISRG